MKQENMIMPFKAVSAAADKAAHLISRTYQDYADEEVDAELRYNPYSFLHILNPGYKFHHELKGTERFQMVRNRYLEFCEEGFLEHDKLPAFYIYQNVDPDNTYVGIIAGASCEAYGNGKIKKHEDTLHDREVLFKEYLHHVGFNAEPVLLTYPDDDAIEQIIQQKMTEKPSVDCSTTDRNRHRVWKINDPEQIAVVSDAFEQNKALYIADGHHRSASSYLLGAEMGEENPAYSYFMSLLIPESQLRIYEFNRQVKDLNGLSAEEFLIRLDQHFRIQNRGQELYRPSKKHHFSMYLDGEFYSLYLRKGLYDFKDALSDLDTQMLYDLVLNPILGIEDLRTDERITYSYGVDDLMQMKNRIDGGKYEVGFGLFPATVDQMKKIADADLRMPPKSTFIRPKLPSGLLIYDFEKQV